jgi:membrane-associated phospholipid phosphatase
MVILVVCWIVAFAVALRVDFPIAQWVHDSGFGKHIEGKRWAQVVKAPGDFRFTLTVVVLLVLAGWIRFRQGLFIVLAGVVSGTNPVLKWIVGRHRPYKLPGALGLHPFVFHPFWRGVHGFFDQRDLCFPSGHECVASALAVSMLIVWPRAAWVFVLLAISVAIERVLENAHFASDVMGAVAFGSVGAIVLHKLMRGWMAPTPTEVTE